MSPREPRKGAWRTSACGGASRSAGTAAARTGSVLTACGCSPCAARASAVASSGRGRGSCILVARSPLEQPPLHACHCRARCTNTEAVSAAFGAERLTSSFRPLTAAASSESRAAASPQPPEQLRMVLN